MQFTSLKLSLIVAALASIVKADLIGFSGDYCDGDQGSNVNCDGSCIGFDGHHSYEVIISGTHCITYFLNDDCTVEVGSASNRGSGSCTNVNTDTQVGSLRCSPNRVFQNVAFPFNVTVKTVIIPTPASVN